MNENDLDEIRRRVDIVDLIGHYITLKKAGTNHKGLCPFHQEKTPSFMVSPEKQIFKCFGCSEGGDIFGFIMKMENLSFPEAVRLLADRSGVKLTENTRHPTVPLDTKNQLYNINSLASGFFTTILWKHPAGKPALAYLKNRGLTDETIKKFHLGYAPLQKGLLQVLQKRGFSLQQIQAAGSPDRFFNRIMFPLFDALGNIVGFTGRTLSDKINPKYLNTSETAIFHKSRVIYGLHLAKQEIKKEQKVILVEGQMDVIASHQAGVQNCVASSGTAITIDHLHLLQRYTPNFIFALDNDEAGQNAISKIAELALSEGYSVSTAILPQIFKDPGDLAIKDPKLWQKIINDSIPVVEWFFNRALEKFEGKKLTGDDKKKIAAQLLPILAKLPDIIERSHYIQLLAKKIESKEEILNLALERIAHPEAKPSPLPQPPQANPEISALSLIINHSELMDNIHKEFSSQLFTNPDNITIANQIENWYNKYAKSTNAQKNLAAYLRSVLNDHEQTYLNTVISLHLKPATPGSAEEETDYQGELNQNINQLKQFRRDKKKEEFAKAISAAEQSNDRPRVKQLLSDLQKYLNS